LDGGTHDLTDEKQREKSMLTFEKEQFMGTQSILEKLTVCSTPLTTVGEDRD
jgi:hypothetical protein